MLLCVWVINHALTQCLSGARQPLRPHEVPGNSWGCLGMSAVGGEDSDQGTTTATFVSPGTATRRAASI